MAFLRSLLRGRESRGAGLSSVSVIPVGGAQTAAGVTVTPDVALQVSTVLACVRVLAEDVATLPLIVYRRTAAGRERATDHPLYALLHDRPHPDLDSVQWRLMLQLWLGLWGVAYAEVQRDRRGDIVALWPLPPWRVSALRDPGGRVLYQVSVPTGDRVVLPPTSLFRVVWLTLDGLKPLSPLGVAREAVGLARAADEYGARFFANDARPGIVLSHPGQLSPEAYERLRASWEARHQGLTGAHRVALLEEGMRVETVGIPPEDAQYLQIRRMQVEEICRIYRIPPHVVGHLDRATYANIEHQGIEYVSLSLRPWLVRWETAYRTQLLRPDEQEELIVEHLVEGLLRGDVESRYRAYATGRQWGWLSTNEIRERENLNRIPGGDDYLVPVNMVVAASGGPQRQIRHARSLASIDRRRLREEFARLLELHLSGITRRDVREVLAAAPRELAAGLSAWVEWLRAHYGPAWIDEMAERYLPAVRSYGAAVALLLARELGIEPPAVDEWAQQSATERMVRWASSSRTQLAEVATTAASVGSDPLEAVRQRLEQWRERRAGRAARWDAVELGESATKHTLRAAGVRRYRWSAPGSSCVYCRTLDGRIVEDGQPYLGVGEWQPDGASEPLVAVRPIHQPPAHEGCDCLLVPV